ncbi:MAG: TonB-dependent receptor [Acidobacteriaceae bacterium]
MNLRYSLKPALLLLALSLGLLLPALLFAQTTTATATNGGTLRGHVTDPSGAVITGANVTVSGASGKNIVVESNKEGLYEVKGLAPGAYNVVGIAKGFAPSNAQSVSLAPGAAHKLDITLQIAVEEQHVNVEGSAPTVSVDPDSNASATVLKGKDLDALSDDPDEFQSELSALAGPSTGPNGGQIYIDGFTGGQLPPKSAIREIRVNQNPFSAQYDRPGYGRIEILTKPGSDKYHGEFRFNGNNATFNSKNEFLPNEPGYDSEQYEGSIGGPISKRASFFFNVHRRNINEVAISNPTTGINPDGTPQQTAQQIFNPRIRTEISPRFDFQVNNTNTLNVRYQYEGSANKNTLGSQYALLSQAYNTDDVEHSIQVADTQVYGSKIVNETRYRFQHEPSSQTALNNSPTITVPQAFIAGGNSQGITSLNANRNEFQNYTSIAEGNHFIRFGARIRVSNQSSDSNSNFNGTYTFASLRDYLQAQAGVPGYGPVQYSVSAGHPNVTDTSLDAGLYAEDDWKVRSNLTVSMGLRYETQNDIPDRNNWAPRLGVAWGVAKKTIIRAGYGVFYDRFTQDLIIQAYRLNGLNQQQYILRQPVPFAGAPIISYPVPPPISTLVAAPDARTTYHIDPNLKVPYIMQSAVGIEQQMGKVGTLSVTYINAHGVHQLFTANTNAAYLPSFNPLLGNVNLYTSEGTFKQNQLVTNLNLRVGSRLSLFGYYSLNFANSDTAGPSSVPTNIENLAVDYGRTQFDVRNRVFLGGSIVLPYLVRLSPFLVAQSGYPFNITVGRDLNGDSFFNDRPALAGQGVGPVLNPNPATQTWGQFTFPATGGAAITPYYGTGPGLFTFNLRLSKTIGLGKKKEQSASAGAGGDGDHHGGGGHRGGMGGPRGMGGLFASSTSDRRYNLTLGLSGRNIFNNVNLATPNGNLQSPNFGISTQLAGGFYNSAVANRRIDMQVTFSF